MATLTWMGLLMAAAAPVSDTRAPAPHAGCVDARAVQEARHLDERSVLLKTADAGYRVALAERCPPSESGDLVALAPHGWVCGGKEEYVRAGGRVCAIGSVAALNERDWALALRDHDKRGGTATLGEVTVEAKVAPRRRFAASTEYCVDPRRVRGWNLKGREIVLKTAPRRGTDEASSYRLELGRSCPEADLGTDLTLLSGVGIGWICGHPGDRAMISSSSVSEANAMAVMDLQGALLQPSILTAGFASEGCPIIAVYPVH